jgi:DNA-binding MltR family transcriptional regulator
MLPCMNRLEQMAEVMSEFWDFYKGLAKEGERILVIGGSARIEVALERLLRKVMHRDSGAQDNLFDPDRPIGTLSAKINLAYRMGLIDSEMQSALHTLRKVRNDFAHAVTVVSLAESVHGNRIRAISNCVSPWVKLFEFECERWKQIKSIRRKYSDNVISFIASLVIITMALEGAANAAKPPKWRPFYDTAFLKHPKS